MPLAEFTGVAFLGVARPGAARPGVRTPEVLTEQPGVLIPECCVLRLLAFIACSLNCKSAVIPADGCAARPRVRLGELAAALELPRLGGLRTAVSDPTGALLRRTTPGPASARGSTCGLSRTTPLDITNEGAHLSRSARCSSTSALPKLLDAKSLCSLLRVNDLALESTGARCSLAARLTIASSAALLLTAARGKGLAPLAVVGDASFAPLAVAADAGARDPLAVAADTSLGGRRELSTEEDRDRLPVLLREVRRLRAAMLTEELTLGGAEACWCSASAALHHVPSLAISSTLSKTASRRSSRASRMFAGCLSSELHLLAAALVAPAAVSAGPAGGSSETEGAATNSPAAVRCGLCSPRRLSSLSLRDPITVERNDKSAWILVASGATAALPLLLGAAAIPLLSKPNIL
mmetsp:Transcript_70764/g.133677  ORF Transcript_70764/g.133677 Transcript_70764/m.133677 type:complete len:409 (-) Transcript_70764:768-1994(-)